VRHALPQHLQYREGPGEVASLATDHDRQAAGFGPGGSPRHRRIQPGHAALGGQRRSHFTGGGRLQAGKIDQQLPAASALGNALLTEHHVPHHRRIRQAQQYHVAVTAQFGRVAGQACAGLHQLGAFVRAAVPHGERVTGCQQPPAHGQAHQADSGEPQRRQCSTHERLQRED